MPTSCCGLHNAPGRKFPLPDGLVKANVATDSLGNPLTLQHPENLGAVNDFVEGFIACEARAVKVLKIAAHDRSPLVQAYCAALHMFAENRNAVGNATPYIQRAQAAASVQPETSLRERRFITAVAAWVGGDIDTAITLHQEQAREFPRDLPSVKLGQYHTFNRGDMRAMLGLALTALPAAYDVPYIHGMAAFGWEECNQMVEAERAARRAIAMRRKEPWAHHALAHVLLTTGRIGYGWLFMQDVSPTWTGLNSFMVTHNWWHQALFALALHKPEEALKLYDERVWGMDKTYSQDQVNAVSLLARLELLQVDVGDRWVELGQWLDVRTQDQVSPFLDLHYLVGLAHSKPADAVSQLRHIEQFCASASRADGKHETLVWREVALPLARGLFAHANREFKTAAAHMQPAMHQLIRIGGSYAQRDLFEKIFKDAQIRSRA